MKRIIAANICAFVGVMVVAPVWITAAVILQAAEWVGKRNNAKD